MQRPQKVLCPLPRKKNRWKIVAGYVSGLSCWCGDKGDKLHGHIMASSD